MLVGDGLVGLGLAETVLEWATGAEVLFVPPGFVPLVPGPAAIVGLATGRLPPGSFAPLLPNGDRAGFGELWPAEGDGKAKVGSAPRPSGTGRALCPASGHGVNGALVPAINPNATAPR